MLRDIAGTAGAFAVFALFAFAPGYSLAWALDLVDFRRRGPAARASLALALSIGVCPAIAYLAGRFAPAGAVWLVFAPFWAAFVALLAKERILPRGYRVAKVLAVAWLALGTGSLIDLEWGGRLYYSVIAHDYTLRVAITSAVTRAGIPPPNPYFYPGGPVPLRYHYFWMALCSLAQRTGGHAISARFAAFGGTLWCGLGLMAILALYLRFVDPEGSARLPRRVAIAIALLAVTGLDLFPNLLLMSTGVILPDMEWWNDQVTSWVGTMLWVPHHLASLVACLTGFLLLWTANGRRRNAIVAGFCFASATGCSVYVTFTFAIFLAVWGLIAVVRKWYRETAMLALAGSCAALLVVPTYLMGLRGQASGGAFVVPTIRMFKLPDLMLLSLHVTGWQLALANLLLLPLNYFLELGFFLVVGIIALKTKRVWSRWDLAAATMAGTSMAVCTFLRSGVIGNNDLGARGFLPAQFVLLLWAASLWGKPELAGRALRPWLAFLLVAGVAGTVYEVCLLRLYPVRTEFAPDPDYPYLATDRQFGKRTYAARQVYEQLRQTLPAAAVMEHNPNLELGYIPYGLYADRQLAAESLDCGTVIGGDASVCAVMHPLLNALFNPKAELPPPQVDAVCKQFGIDVLVVRDTDPVWADPRSWVWTRRPLAANSMVRALPCGEPAK
ncbi:MAG: hypothetical protein P4L56_06135 [Candidatus Sulfopaludibacter sp.]|nr:hypothetical protein [Candidatus Sulfopaludibacter sp.]